MFDEETHILDEQTDAIVAVLRQLHERRQRTPPAEPEHGVPSFPDGSDYDRTRAHFAERNFVLLGGFLSKLDSMLHPVFMSVMHC